MADPENSRIYFFGDSQFSSLVRAGCIEVTEANLLPLGEAHFRGSAEEVVLRLSYPAKRAADSASVIFHMFHLPAREGEFRRISEWYGERKKRPKFAEGMVFELSLFSAGGVPPEWLHDAWAHGNCDIIHTYTSASRGMLIRWSGTKVAMLSHPLLAMVHEKLRVRADQWETALPEVQRKPDHDYAFTAEAITPSLREEIRQAADRACQRLKIDPDAPAQTIVLRISDELDILRLNRGKLETSERDALAIDLGALWGQALCLAADWHWCRLLRNGQDTATVVCSPGESHMINPISNLNVMLKSPEKINNSLLLFNMIAAGGLPAAPSAALMELS